MAETRHKPSGKWIVQAIDHKFTPMDESATPRRWRSFSPDMWSLYVAWVRSLQQRVLWETYNDVVADTLPLYILPEEPPETECPDCPGPEPEPPQPPPGSGGSSPVGRLGFTLEELEDFFMGNWLRGQLAWVDGKLMYAGSGCDEWCEVPVLSGAKPSGLTAGEIAALSDGSLGLTQWEEAGQPSSSSGASPIPSENPFYTTSDANACAKASAFIDTMHELLIDVRDGLETSGETFIASAGVISGIAGFTGFLTVPAAVLTGYSWFIGGLVGRSKTETISQINAAIDDLAGWTASYCALVPLMEPQVTAGIFTGNLSTEKDYKSLITVLNQQLPVGTHVAQIFNTFPIQAFLESVNEKLPTQECKCSQYLPYGYVPPSQQGAINFMELIYSGVLGSASSFAYASGLPYEGMQLSPDQGQIVSGSSWRTTYTGADTDSGEPNKYTQLSILLDMPANTQIEQVKFDVVVQGVVQGSGIVQLEAKAAVLDASAVWSVVTNGVFALATANDLVYDNPDLLGTKLALNFKTRNENINLYATISNIRLTGNADGAGFLDVPIGTPLP